MQPVAFTCNQIFEKPHGAATSGHMGIVLCRCLEAWELRTLHCLVKYRLAKLQQLWHLVTAYSNRVVRCSHLADHFDSEYSMAAIYVTFFYSHDREFLMPEVTLLSSMFSLW